MGMVKFLSTQKPGDTLQLATSENSVSGKHIKSQCFRTSGPGRLDKATILECQNNFVKRIVMSTSAVTVLEVLRCGKRESKLENLGAS